MKDFIRKNILGISFAISIFIHILLFVFLYFLSVKPEKPQEEKVITVSIEEALKSEKPNLPKIEKPIPSPPQEEIQKPKPIEKPKPEKKPEIKQETKPAEEQKVKPEQSKPQIEPEQSTTTNQETKQEEKVVSPKPETKPTQQQPQQPIDITKGKTDKFETLPKKEEDIDGYLKELIRYLNEVARERDLYPPLAKRLKIEGEVVVRVTINEDGTIDENSIKIVEGSGYNVLDKGAIEILKKLSPYKKPPKKITVEIPIVFQIINM